MVSGRNAILSQIKHIGRFTVDMCTRVRSCGNATKSTFQMSENAMCYVKQTRKNQMEMKLNVCTVHER